MDKSNPTLENCLNNGKEIKLNSSIHNIMKLATTNFKLLFNKTNEKYPLSVSLFFLLNVGTAI